MTNWMDKAKDFIKGHPDQAKDAVEKVEDLLNEKTGGRYAEQIDQGSDALSDQLGLPSDPEDKPAPTPVPSEPAPTPADTPAPAPTPTDAGPTGSDTGSSGSVDDVPELPIDPGAETGLPRDRVPPDAPADVPADAPADVPADDQPSPDLTLDDPPSTTS